MGRYYRRNYRGRGRRPRRKLYKKPMRYQVADYAYKAYKGVRYLKGLVNAEKKFHELTISKSVSTTGDIDHLTAIAQGDTNSDRNGNSVLLRGIFIKLVVTMHASATDSLVRIMLFRDNQQVGDTSPAISSVLASAGISSFLNNTQFGRYSILCNKVISLNSGSMTEKYIQITKPQKIHIRYNGTASTDIQKNGYYLMYISNEATNTPSVNGTMRLHYYDN